MFLAHLIIHPSVWMKMCKHLHPDIITCVTQFRDLTWSSILIKILISCVDLVFLAPPSPTLLFNSCKFNFIGISQIFTVNLELLVGKQEIQIKVAPTGYTEWFPGNGGPVIIGAFALKGKPEVSPSFPVSVVASETGYHPAWVVEHRGFHAADQVCTLFL